MGIQRDKIVIVDIEATCWETDPPPEGQVNEIIEVGVCLFEVKSRDLSAKRSIFVRPEKSVVSEFCTKLTTITPEQVASGVAFAEACQILESDYDTLNRAWMSWGSYDRRMFKEQCQDRAVRYPFSKKHINLKSVHGKLNGGQRVGMARAMKKVGLEFVGTHHRGDDDAWNIGRLLDYLLRVHGDKILRKYW